MQNLQGEYLHGTYLGTRIAHGKPDSNGQSKQTVYCGVSYIKQGAYGDEMVTKELCVSKGLIEKGIPAKLHAFEGKQVALPFFEMAWSNGNGKTLFLANNVTDLFAAQPVKAAG